MGLYEARGNLTKGMKELMQRWLDTKALWRDAAAQQFEEKYIASMERDFRSAVSAMDHAGKIVAQIRNECGEQRD
ncbi:MAG: hypothetical protein IT448_04525 [Phycisphaerales bacterium]|nr:hypothetical protein [Phycisphaerales bacterium]